VAGEFGAGGLGEKTGAVAADLADFFEPRFAKIAVSSRCPI
jgi:hypothetical protein